MHIGFLLLLFLFLCLIPDDDGRHNREMEYLTLRGQLPYAEQKKLDVEKLTEKEARRL